MLIPFIEKKILLVIIFSGYFYYYGVFACYVYILFLFLSHTLH